jgi:8-oxo-dGTP pyrophosphatase MutT (NUDIX family)
VSRRGRTIAQVRLPNGRLVAFDYDVARARAEAIEEAGVPVFSLPAQQALQLIAALAAGDEAMAAVADESSFLAPRAPEAPPHS